MQAFTVHHRSRWKTQKTQENRANALERLHNQPGMVPFEYHMLDHAQTEKMLPEIGPDVVGASFCPLDGHVNALRLLRALGLVKIDGDANRQACMTMVRDGMRIETQCGKREYGT